MSSYWYYSRDGRISFGPLTWQELMRMASTGEFLPSDVVVHVERAKSMRAGTVPGLFAPSVQPSGSVETIGSGVSVVAGPDRQGR